MTHSVGSESALSLQEIALVVLAAGRSTRMGSPKAIVDVEGRPLVEHLLAPPLFRAFGDVVVVVGHHAGDVIPVVERLGYRHVMNPHPDRGRTGSVQSGLIAIPAAIRAVFVQPVDCPLILPRTYVALAAALGAADAAVPVYRRRNGHPPLLAARVIPQILAAEPDVPLRDILQAPGVDCRFVEVDDPGVLLNIDRPEDLRLLTHLRSARGAEKTPGHGPDNPTSNGPSTAW